VRFRAFVKWGVSSMLGHFVLFGVPSFVAFFALGLYQNHTEQTLTLAWLPYIVLYAALAGLGMPLIVWYSMTRPLLRRMNRKR
jgi:hypothetical protein